MNQTKNEKAQPDDKKSKSTKSPIKVIRCGAIAASIWKRQTSTGFEYLDYSLSRSWKLKNGEREGYSQNFFEGNEEALMEVIELASHFIREQQPDMDRDQPSPAKEIAGPEPLAA